MTQLERRLTRNHADFATDRPSCNWLEDVNALLGATDSELQQADVARLNLTVGLGLPTMETREVFACLPVLDRWAELVKMNTEHWWPQYESQPDGSPARFRMLCLVTILQKHIGVQYNLGFNEGDYDARDPRNHFLHGILSGHGGTCVTMPLLYVAIGRRLGYPLHLVRAKEHVFVRWEGHGDRFNVDATSPGFTPRDDDYYLRWPKPLSTANLDSGCYLHNLSRREEVALFLHERGCCLRDLLRLREALEAFALADRFAPNDACILGQWAVTEILWRAFEQQKHVAISEGRQSCCVDEVSMPRLNGTSLGQAEQEWASAHLARLKRLHRHTTVTWADSQTRCSSIA